MTATAVPVRRLAWLGVPAAVLLIAAGKLGVHLATGWRYGFHRDELYYIAGGLRPDFGYVDHPPLTPLLASLVYQITGDAVGLFRVLPALGGAALVILAALTARELGGGRLAQILTALAVAACPVFLATNGMFQTVTFDQLIWAAVILLFLRLLKTGDERLWLAIGVAGGVGLLTKYTIGLLAVGLVVGLLASGPRRWLRTRWPYLAAGIALVIAAPNIVWQIANDFPSLEFTQNNNANEREGPLGWIGMQFIFIGFLAIPLFLIGVHELLRSPAARRYRSLGWATAAIFVVVVALGAKPYYVGPLYPLAFAAGAIVIERQVRERGRTWLTPAMGALLVLNGLIPAVLLLPIVPPEALQDAGINDINKELGEMVGWPDLVNTVETAYADLPPEGRARTAIVTQNYGEAGALEILGGDLPDPFSGHNSYYFWEPENERITSVLAVGFGPGRAADLFGECTEVATITNPAGVENEEYGASVRYCPNLPAPLPDLWPELKHFN